MAQALGPANDLYRIPDTVFNDDNFHSVLTSFDMLMLRALYDPALPAGASEIEVSSKILAVLNRLNPRGRNRAPAARAPVNTAWKSAVESALDRRRSRVVRRNASRRAIGLALAMQPTDHRLGLSLLTYGRVLLRRDPVAAREQFDLAYRQFVASVGPDDIRTAHAALHLALLALREGRLTDAEKLAADHILPARRAENAVVLSGLLAIRSEALAGTRSP